MLYDRPYMREPQYRPSTLKPLYWLLGSIAGVFIIQNLAANWFQSPVFHLLFALSNYAVEKGFIWVFVTHSFMHGGMLHLLFNGIMLFWLGRILLRMLGAQRFFTLYGLCVLVGGVLWFMVNFWQNSGASVIGASGGVMGLLVAFAMHFPNQPIQLLLFFVIPIRITPKKLVIILLLIDLAGLLFNELAPFGGGIPIAHSAHLGGMLGGWVFVKFILNRDFTINAGDIKLPKWITNKKTKQASTGRFRINFTNRNELQQEVDRILDKINTQGFGSLSEEEKSTLDKAKEILNR
ncbi:MAG: rhomboid family intramembrane serine protease [Verrucomicrobia bacterium]|nr:rhomboid family intramembrane serine protease [Verrucomicrobiota bacterium]